MKHASECTYLYHVYNTTLQQIVKQQYNVNCPSSIIDIISKLAHDEKDLQDIIKDKLIYSQYFERFYGKTSLNYQKLRYSISITNGLKDKNKVVD